MSRIDFTCESCGKEDYSYNPEFAKLCDECQIQLPKHDSEYCKKLLNYEKKTLWEASLGHWFIVGRKGAPRIEHFQNAKKNYQFKLSLIDKPKCLACRELLPKSIFDKKKESTPSGDVAEASQRERDNSLNREAGMIKMSTKNQTEKTLWIEKTGRSGEDRYAITWISKDDYRVIMSALRAKARDGHESSKHTLNQMAKEQATHKFLENNSKCKHLPDDTYFYCYDCKCYHKYLHPTTTLDGGSINEKHDHYKNTDPIECINCGEIFK